MEITAAGMRRRPPTRLARRPRPTRALAHAAVLAVALAAALLSGCAGPAPLRPGPAPPAPRPARMRPAAGYVARRDSLPAVDPALLAGRRIVLDPGHGGFFKGAVGVGGLTEAAVNLGVALDLDTLLRARGARVLMTRRTDRDFTTPADSSLKHDLGERVRIANAFAPDLFVSIHHNADPGGAHDVNETQTYYQLGDDGPSYDAGADVHRALVRNLGIEAQKLMPGNFAVVRGSESPALLTEASYVTNPDVEAKLATPAARRLEAEALLVGIARFFARKAPAIERLEVAGADPAGRVREGGRPAITARAGGPFDEATLRVDGELVAPLTLGDSLCYVPDPPLASGPHTASLAVCLAGEGSSRVVRRAFVVRKRFARILVDFPGQPQVVRRGTIGLRVQALDEDGLPLAADTLAVRVRAVGARPRDTVVVIHDGAGWAYFREAPERGAARAERARYLVSAWRPRGSAAKGGPPETTAELTTYAGSAPGWRAGFAHAMPGDAPLRLAPELASHAGASWVNRDGFVVLAEDSLRRVRAPRLPGYRAWGADTTWPPRFVPIAAGAFTGKRIVLDPEGGGDDDGGGGPSGTRAATLNLQVARALAGMLGASGAEVLLTREGDAAVSDVERVQRGEGFRPDRYLRIAHAAAPPVAGHYFSSAGGRRWAQRLATVCARLGVADSLPVAEVAKYAITQTSAVALYASIARIDDPASESRLLAPGALRAEAYALYLALAEDLANAPELPIESVRVLDGAGAPIPAALVTLGGALVLQADADGRVRYARTEPGPVLLETSDPRASPRTVLLDSNSSRVPAGPR
jgi:N-acetylmuramoyl-L-alanine amidase